MNDEKLVFDHERLEVFQVATEFLQEAAAILKQLPRGESNIKDQFKRAADSLFLNTSEGAGRFSKKDKAHFYDIARGSATECAAVLEVFRIRELAPEDKIETARTLLHRTVSMLTALSKSMREPTSSF